MTRKRNARERISLRSSSYKDATPLRVLFEILGFANALIYSSLVGCKEENLYHIPGDPSVSSGYWTSLIYGRKWESFLYSRNLWRQQNE